MTDILKYLFDVFRNVFRALTFGSKSLTNRMSVFVKFNSGQTLAVDLDPKWDIKNVKDIIASEIGASPKEVRIIFAGRELEDSLVIEDCDLGEQSTLHAVRLKSTHAQTPKYKGKFNLNETISDVEEASSDSERSNRSITQFFTYCIVCNGVTVGKLRVRCSSCKSGAFTVDTDPKSWNDVLKPNKISGHCEQDGCEDGVFGYAEFYFKCAEHLLNNDTAAVPLNLIKNNFRYVPCLACTEIKDIVFIFPCKEAHVTCLDCFRNYAVIRLRERQFVINEEIGYTISCPAGCSDSFIEECHHFKLLSTEQYEMYQRFATEECVLHAGGVLCPQPGCGEGILIDKSGCNKIVCANGCGYVFCQKCLQGFHIGECVICDNPIVIEDKQLITDPERALQARWEEASSIAIRITTKPCPKCRTPTERSGGCMHMICTRCMFHWCWVCQAEWNRECMGTHWFG